MKRLGRHADQFNDLLEFRLVRLNELIYIVTPYLIKIIYNEKVNNF